MRPVRIITVSSLYGGGGPEVAERVALELIDRLPRSPQEFEQYIERGYALAQRMSWDVVARDYVLPGIARAAKAQRLRQIA